jgi:hypothetical protein
MIYFKDWLRHDEVYSHDVVISGPFRFYHGTSSGSNDEVLNSFKREGARSSGYGHGQGGGLFLWTSEEKAKRHSLDRMNNELDGLKGSFEGSPIVVVIDVPSIDFGEWDLDIENHAKDILSYASRRVGKLNKLGDVSLSDKTRGYLSKDGVGEKLTGSDAGPIPFSYIKKNPNWKSFSAKYPGKMFGIRDPLLNAEDDDYYNVGTAQKVAPFYYAHQDRNPELHKKLESWFFQNNYNKNPMALKYTGEVSLPVTKILVYNGQNWIES